MVDYSEEQQKIARLLLEGPKTLEELRESTGADASKLNEELKGMLNLKVIVRDNEDKYKLTSFVEKQVKGFSEEIQENFKFRLTIEGLSMSEEALMKQLQLMENKLKADKLKIISFEKSDPYKHEKNFTAFIEIEAWVTEFVDILRLIVNYGPSAVELIYPKEMKFDIGKAQDILNEMSSAVHYYVGMVLQLKHKEFLEKQKNAQN